MSAYATPSLYDILMTPGTAREADVLEALHDRYVHGHAADRPWLEPACGSGRLLRVLARRGRRVRGYDLDPDMVAYARGSLKRRGLTRRACVARGDMTSPPAFDAPFGFVFNPWNSLRHLPDDRSALAHLDATAASMAPGGVYAVGISLSSPDGDPHEEDVWQAARGGCRVLQLLNFEPLEGRIERAHAQFMIHRGEREEFLTASYDLRTYTADQWRRLLGRSALRRIASLDLRGRDRAGRDLPYQLDILTHAEG